MKIGQNVCLDKTFDQLRFGSRWVINSVRILIYRNTLDQLSRGHISCSFDLKFGQNVYHNEIFDEYKFGSPWVIN